MDTLDFANKLKEAGLDAKVAETHAKETAKIIGEITMEHLATKKDIQKLSIDLHKMKVDMFRIASWSITILGSLQALFHFIDTFTS